MISRFRPITIRVRIKDIVYYVMFALVLSLVSIVFFRTNILTEERDADINDFKSFLASNPYPGFDSTSYSNDLKFFFDLFEQKSSIGWQNYIWHRNNIWPLWIEYKHKNNLKVYPNYY